MSEPVREQTEEERKAEARRINLHRAELFVAMGKSDAWQQYLHVLEVKRGKLAEKLLAQFVTAGPTAPPVDQRTLDYDRGFVDGMMYARDVINSAQKTLEELQQQENEVSEPENDERPGEWT